MAVKLAKRGAVALVVVILGYFALTVAANIGVSVVIPKL